MNEGLRLESVAEEVAVPARLGRLIEQQCLSGQGELFSGGARPEDISAMLDTSQAPL
ncbi:hypothetical protein [Streptomyces sp.]|uniref:hypothetical protein n=1 Tax=Streptomyces sp. TaxID=1931 RepID=UPI002D78A59C|nr:hypothetical protein [Streptomyces sp.]HET6359731.1 hypothetical protein [Streptomyces sp.]